jgi:hypothetical protein
VTRGGLVSLRVLLTDEAASTLQFSLAGAAPDAAVAQSDGSFLAVIDTSAAPPAATSLAVQFTARDALGNTSTMGVNIPITRLRWRAPSPVNDSIVGIAAIGNSVFATTSLGNFVAADRTAGTRTQASLGSLAPSGNLAINESAVYTALADGRVCKLGFDGSVLWCCASLGPISGLIALGPMPALQAGAAPVDTVIATTASSQGRFVAIRDATANSCNFSGSNPVAIFLSNSPAIAPDGTLYATAGQAIATGIFDGVAWTTQAFSVPGAAIGQPAFSAPLLTDGVGQRILFATDNEMSQVYAEFFPAPSAAGMLPQTPSVKFAALPSPNDLRSTTPAFTEDGTAIVATGDSFLVAIAPDGSLEWSTALASEPSAAPAVGAGGVIYTAGNDGTLAAYGLDGGPLWSFQTGASIVAPPSPGCDGAIYVGTSAGEILSIAADHAGLANSIWPREGHDTRGTGDARRPLRDLDGGCLE